MQYKSDYITLHYKLFIVA